MSRIYQGGQSQNSYQARNRKKSYSPVQAISEATAYKEEGARKLRDLQTQSRETERANQMSNAERDASNRAQATQLDIEQRKASQLLKQQQLVEKADQQTAELIAQSELKMSQTTEKGQVSIQQVKDKGVQRLNQLRESNAQQLKQLEETSLLKSQHTATRADNNLSLQHLQLNQQIDTAKTKLLSTTISSLISFGGEVANYVARQEEKQEEVDTEQVKAASFHYALTEAPVTSSGVVNPSITREANLRKLESAEGLAIEQVAPGDFSTQEALRQPSADASMTRSQRIGLVTAKSLTFGSRLNDARHNPNTMVFDRNGQSVPITSLRGHQEYENGLYQIAQRISFEDKVHQGSDYAIINAYGPAMRTAITAAQSEQAGKIEARNIAERSSSTSSTSAHLLQQGLAQSAWNHAWNGSKINGDYSGKNTKERGIGVLESIMGNASDKGLEELKTVQLESGGTLGDHPTYGALIIDEQLARDDRRADVDEMASARATLQVKETVRAMNIELLQGGPDADVGAIKQSYAATLKSFGTAEADDEASTLLKGDYKASPALYQSYLDQFGTGDPPDSSDVISDFTTGKLTSDMFQTLKKMGDFGDQIDQRITASGVPKAETMAKEIVSEATALVSRQALGVGASNMEQTNTLITNSIAPEIRMKLRAFAVANPDAKEQDYLVEANRIQNEIRGRLKPTEPSLGELKWTASGGFEYSGLRRKVSILTTKSADGKRTITFYDNVNVSDIPSHATSEDRYFTQEEAKVSGEKYMSGALGGDFSPRTQAIAKKLNQHPRKFVLEQLGHMGYKISTDFNTTSAVQGGKVIDPAIMEGLNVIGKYESDEVGSYNAVNQIGRKQGKEVDGYSGHYSKLGGQDLTSMSLAEIMELQDSRPGMSDQQWKDEGRLHAVGRYQFVGKTLRGTAEAMGISPSEKFTPELQDRMGAWLLSEYGMGQWVGITRSGGATPQEKVLLTQIRQKLQAARAILSNPNAGNIQRARAMRTLGQAFG